MGFKIEKKAESEPVFCDYIQNKIDVAKNNHAIYELDDEDKRVQALYNQEELITIDRIKGLKRIKRQDNGDECLVVDKDVYFYFPSANDPKKPGSYKDRYSDKEGLVQLPLKRVNEDGVESANQTQLEYTIPFTKGAVQDYIKKADGRTVELTFYEGPTTSNRVPTNIPKVGNLDMFTDATWGELQIAREKKVVDSAINRLPEIRKELRDKGVDTQQEVNKEANTKDDGGEKQGETRTESGSTELKLSATNSKQGDKATKK